MLRRSSQFIYPTTILVRPALHHPNSGGKAITDTNDADATSGESSGPHGLFEWNANVPNWSSGAGYHRSDKIVTDSESYPDREYYESYYERKAIADYVRYHDYDNEFVDNVDPHTD